MRARRPSLASAMVLAIAAAIAVPAAGGYVAVRRSEAHLRRALLRRLDAAVEDKRSRAEALVAARIQAVQWAAAAPGLSIAMRALEGAGEGVDPDAPRRARRRLARFVHAFRHPEIELLDARGRLVLPRAPPPGIDESADRRDPAARGMRPLFEAVRATLTAATSGYVWDAWLEQPALYVGAPVLAGGRFAGVLIAPVGADEIETLWRDRHGLGDTATVELIALRGGRLRVRALGSTPDGMVLHTTVAATERPTLSRAAGGESLAERMRGAAGTASLGAARFVPSLRLALLVREEARDAERGLRRFRAGVAAYGLLVTLATALVLWGVWIGVARPLARLRLGADAIAAGAYDRRVLVRGPREAAHLAAAFNRMADRVQAGVAELQRTNAALEERVLERTAELRLANVRVRAALEALERTRDIAIHQEKLAALGGLAAGVAHEVNNPLMGLLNYIEYAARRCSTPRALEALERARVEVERIAAIVRTMLDYARPSSSAAMGRAQDCVRQTLELVRPELRLAGVRVSDDVPDDLPPVWLDRDALQQVLLNVLLNARDALAGRPEPAIRLRAELAEHTVTLVVEDNGPGFPPELRGRLFDPFFTTKEPGKGSGMGLAISHNLVAGLGGDLLAGDSPLGGAALCIVLLREPPAGSGADSGEKAPRIPRCP